MKSCQRCYIYFAMKQQLVDIAEYLLNEEKNDPEIPKRNTSIWESKTRSSDPNRTKKSDEKVPVIICFDFTNLVHHES